MRVRFYALVLLSALIASPTQASWREARSQHFVIYSEQNAASLQKFAEGLERLDKGLRITFDMPDYPVSRAGRVTVFILPNIGSVRKAYGAKSSSGIAGFYRDWPSGPVAFVPRSTDGGEDFGFDSTLVLQHEYAHHFLTQNFTSVFPAWFAEGFAEFASTTERRSDGSVFFGMPANHRAYALLMESELPIEKLLDGTTAMRSADLDKFYGRSWLLCHYLIIDPARAKQLPAYIRHINSGMTNMDAARAAFGDLNKLSKDLNGYLRRIQSNLKGYRLPQSDLPIGPVTVRELGPGEAAIMNVRIESKAGVNKEEAATVVATARKIAVSFPNDAEVQTALAEAELDAGNYAEAIAAADRAVASNPKSVDALTYKASAKMALAQESDKDEPATWREVRKLLAAANRLDPDHPGLLSLFFLSYLRQGIPPTENAVDGALRALELAPQDKGFRMTLATYLLRQDKPAQARATLLRLAADPHDEGVRSLATAMISALDTGGTKAALAAMTRQTSDGAPEGGESADKGGK